MKTIVPTGVVGLGWRSDFAKGYEIWTSMKWILCSLLRVQSLVEEAGNLEAM